MDDLNPPSPESPRPHHLVYVVNHSFKHNISGCFGNNPRASENKNGEVLHDAVMDLWTLKDDPRYLAYPESVDVPLGDFIGSFPTDEKIIEQLLGHRGTLDDLYSYARMARSNSENSGYSGEPLEIPEHKTLVRRGLLTDIVAATGKTMLKTTFKDAYVEKLLRILSQRAGVDVDTFSPYILAKLQYDLYTIGYVLPHLDRASGAHLFRRSASSIFKETDTSPAAIREKYRVDV